MREGGVQTGRKVSPPEAEAKVRPDKTRGHRPSFHSPRHWDQHSRGTLESGQLSPTTQRPRLGRDVPIFCTPRSDEPDTMPGLQCASFRLRLMGTPAWICGPHSNGRAPTRAKEGQVQQSAALKTKPCPFDAHWGSLCTSQLRGKNLLVLMEAVGPQSQLLAASSLSPVPLLGQSVGPTGLTNRNPNSSAWVKGMEKGPAVTHLPCRP